VATGIRPFRTKPRVAVELVEAARQSKVSFREVVADCFYGDNPAFTQAFDAAGVPFVLALKPRKGTWAPAEAAPLRPRRPALACRALARCQCPPSACSEVAPSSRTVTACR
jgi:SRSO17 transposase